jgi:4-amino-4-deoxy-L-arabinose transferase-like glycosyltransferase
MVFDLWATVSTERANSPILTSDSAGTSAKLAIGLVAIFAGTKLLLHFVTIFFTPYEIHRDEFLYLAMGEHLRLWNMDFPPAIAILANTARLVFGDTLFAIRFFPAIAGAAIVALTAMLVRELGGGRGAQAMAMLAVMCNPLFMRTAVLFQPVVFDQLCWTLGLCAMARLARGPRLQDWILLGVAFGLGLLNKFSILFFGAAAFVGFLLSPQRRMVFSRGAWIALAITLLLGSPSIVGQVRLGFPVTIHMADLQTQQLHRVTHGEYLSGQVLMLGPSVLLAGLGLWFLVSARAMRQCRALGLTCAAVFVLLLFLHGKPYYTGPIYPALFAAGATVVFGWPSGYARWLRLTGGTLILLFGLFSLPFGLPILPPERMARYAARAGLTTAVTTNQGKVLPLPQDYADMIGWKDQVQAVARAFASLSVERQAVTGLFAQNYGQAGALEFYGPRLGLTAPIMLPNNFLLWPAKPECEAILTVGISEAYLQKFFAKVSVLDRFDHPWMVPEERNLLICLAAQPTRDLQEAWKRRSRK